MIPMLGPQSGEPPAPVRTAIPNLDYIVGLDLGKQSDFTAMAVIERKFYVDPAQPGQLLKNFGVRYLKRWKLGTPYTEIVPDVVKLVGKLPVEWPLLAVDQTGVGSAVVDMIKVARPSATLHPVMITGGHQYSRDQFGVWHVPKSELVSVMNVVLQSDRLPIANMPERELLQQELLNFKVKITDAGNETFAAWRDRDHDDLVLAVAMAVWLGERGHPFQAPGQYEGRKTVRGIEDRREQLGQQSAQRRRGLFGLS